MLCLPFSLGYLHDLSWKDWKTQRYIYMLILVYQFAESISFPQFIEVAELCVFLASNKSSYITGSCIEITGRPTVIIIYIIIATDHSLPRAGGGM